MRTLYAVNYELTICLAKSYAVGGEEGKHEKVFVSPVKRILPVIET